MTKYNIIVCCYGKILVNVAVCVCVFCAGQEWTSANTTVNSWRWCINTETCPSNFNINLQYLLVHVAVYNKVITQLLLEERNIHLYWYLDILDKGTLSVFRYRCAIGTAKLYYNQIPFPHVQCKGNIFIWLYHDNKITRQTAQ